MAMVNTGLGWECPSEYLVYAADTDLGYAQNRDYYKKNDGYAAAMFMYDTAGYQWRGPLLISTDPDAVAYYYGGTLVGYSGTFQYLRRTWYYNVGNWMPGGDYGMAGLIPFYGDFPSYTIPVSEVMRAVRQAGVKPYVSRRGVSFAAGLAAGLAAREWAYRP